MWAMSTGILIDLCGLIFLTQRQSQKWWLNDTSLFLIHINIAAPQSRDYNLTETMANEEN